MKNITMLEYYNTVAEQRRKLIGVFLKNCEPSLRDDFSETEQVIWGFVFRRMGNEAKAQYMRSNPLSKKQWRAIRHNTACLAVYANRFSKE